MQAGELDLLYSSPSSVVCFCPFVSKFTLKTFEVSWLGYIHNGHSESSLF